MAGVQRGPSTRLGTVQPTLANGPLEVAGLHRTFAELEPTKESIRSFACEFGLLGRHTTMLVILVEAGQVVNSLLAGKARFPVRDEIGIVYWGESFHTWTAEILRMRQAVQIWDLLEDPTKSGHQRLEELVQLEGDLVTVRESAVPAGFQGYVRPFCGAFDLEAAPDEATRLRLAARVLLRHVVNQQLATATKAGVDTVSGSQVVLIPQDLLAAMWVQFASEIIGTLPPMRLCKACKRYFLVEHGRQLFCNGNCKSKGYRQDLKKKRKGNQETYG